MDKEQLIKLAEIAGVEVKWNDEHEWDDGAFMIQVEDNDYSYWRPHEDLNQAFECLEALGKDYDMCKSSYLDHQYDVEIFAEEPSTDHIKTHAKTINEAICKAVLKATEQG